MSQIFLPLFVSRCIPRIEIVADEETSEIVVVENETDEYEMEMTGIRLELEQILFADGRISKALIVAVLEKYGRGKALIRKLTGQLKYMEGRVDQMHENHRKRTMESAGEASQIKQAVAEMRQLSFAAIATKC